MVDKVCGYVVGRGQANSTNLPEGRYNLVVNAADTTSDYVQHDTVLLNFTVEHGDTLGPGGPGQAEPHTSDDDDSTTMIAVRCVIMTPARDVLRSAPRRRPTLLRCCVVLGVGEWGVLQKKTPRARKFCSFRPFKQLFVSLLSKLWHWRLMASPWPAALNFQSSTHIPALDSGRRPGARPWPTHPCVYRQALVTGPHAYITVLMCADARLTWC